jgi:3-oxoacyl-[acyl-carrier protein] reductase
MAVLGHAATTSDLAEQVVAFCRSDSVTGQTLPIDGGLFPR